MKKRMAWYLGGGLLLGLAVLAISCASPLFPQPAPEPPVAAIVPPAIPHELEGRADCLMCHKTGIGGAPQFPADHSQRPSDVCLTCHESASAKKEGSALTTTPAPPHTETTPTAVSAEGIYANRCAACHGANRQGTPGLASALTPESLAAASDTEIKGVISDGRPGTAMPAFKGTLSPAEIDALLQLIKYSKP